MANADAMSLIAQITSALETRGEATALRSKRYGLWQPISARAVLARSRAIAAGLGVIGLQQGETAAIIGDNCAEWVLADLGIMAAGGASAGLDAFCDGDELARLVNSFGARVLFVVGDDQLHKALKVRERCPSLREIIVMHQQWDDGAGAGHVLPLADLEAPGEGAPAVPQPASDATAAILLTSGVTAPSRGALFSHRALGAQAARAASALGLTDRDERLSLMPIHHAFERVTGIYASLLAGTVVNFAESRETVPADLAELQPTVVQASPQAWSRMKSRIELAMAEATPFQQRICRSTFAKASGRKAGPLADWLVLSPIRRRLGLSRARQCVSGGAVLHPGVAAWFAALGRPLTDIYGHAETAGFVSLTRYRGARTMADGTALEISGDEIAVRSDALFSGYAGGEAHAAPSWRTGDAALGPESAPQPAGRVGDMIQRGGDRVAPFETESALLSSPYIADAFLHGDERGRAIASILLAYDPVVKYAQDHSIPFTHFLSLCRAEAIRDLIAREVAAVNNTASLQIDDFTLIERPLGPGHPEVAPTLALRRRLLRPLSRDLQPGPVSENV